MAIQKQFAWEGMGRFMGCCAITAGIDLAFQYSSKNSKLSNEKMTRIAEVVEMLSKWHPNPPALLERISSDTHFDPTAFAQEALKYPDEVFVMQRVFGEVQAIKARTAVASYIENRDPNWESDPSPYKTVEDLRDYFHKLAADYI